MSTEKVTYLLELRDKFSKNLGKANKGLNQLDKNSSAASLSLGKVQGALVGLGIAAVAKSIFTAGVNMEQTRVAFATFLGDAEKGNKVIAELNQFSNVTPFDNDAVIKSGRVLLAARIPAEKLTGTLKNIGDVASGAQVPLIELSSIYSKISNKGKAQAEELNQLAERGIPILDVLAKKFGTTAAGVLEMGSKGKITSQVIGEAFESMASKGGMFFNMMEKQSATTGGKLSTLQGSLGLLAAELGESMNPSLTGIIDKLIVFTNYLKDNKETVITLAKWVGIGSAAFAAYKATVFATQKAIMIYNVAQKAAVITNIFLTKGLKKARIAMRLFNVTTKASPLGLVISAMVILAPLMWKLFSTTSELTAKQKLLNDVNKKSASIYAESASKLRIVQSVISAGNVTQEKRKDIIKELNKNYGQYLDHLLTEKSTDEDIAKAIERINEQLLKKAKIQALEEKISETSKRQLELELERADAARVYEKAQTGVWNTVKKLLKSSSPAGFVTAEVDNLINAYDELDKGIKGTQDEMGILLKLLADSKLGTNGLGGGKKGGGNGIAILDEKSKDKLETGIKAGAPKIININIKNVVEKFTIETKQINEAPIRVKEEMTKVLMDAINDASILQQ